MQLSGVARTIAIQEDPAAIVQAAVDGAYHALGTETTFAATARPDRGDYLISATHGHFGRRFHQIAIPPMIGLGGRVAVQRQPMAVHDYATDCSITKHFVDIVVGEEGLRGIACTPVISSAGVEALLYAGLRSPGFLEDRALECLQQIAAYAGVAIDQALAQVRHEELVLLRERQRIAAALHDSVAQVLFAIGVEAKQSRAQANKARLADALTEIEALAAKAGRELRETLYGINEIPESLALDAVVEAEARLFERAFDGTVRVIRRGTPHALPDAYESLILDTVREGLRNALKHADAHLIAIHVYYRATEVSITVQTEGNWVRAADGEVVEPRGGLALLRGRAEVLRGSLKLEVGDDGETILRLRLPCGGVALL